MAYCLAERFSPPQKYYRLLDPGAYQEDTSKSNTNKVPFLCNTPRNTQGGVRIWTHAIYNADLPPKIPNCTSLISKRPRFPYEAFSKEDLAEILCRCGIENPCECSIKLKDQEDKVNYCQAKVRKCIYKGPTPRSVLGEGLSAPSKRDHGFEILSDGSKIRIKDDVTDESPPFYDARVNESTAFYQGCKWSRWTSMRTLKSLEVRPGPSDYTLDRSLTHFEICAEKLRSNRRKTSKQLRFIEMVQRKDVLANHPGPANYTPNLPKSTDLQYLGPKAERFPISKYDERPGPADYWLRRAFDPSEPPQIPCHAKLPEPAFFGIKAPRFKPRQEEGASPASYCPSYKPCQFLNCSTAPFGSSSMRFKNKVDESEFEENTVTQAEDENIVYERCTTPTWEFKSKTIRMKPLGKKLNEASPADLPQPRSKVKRSQQQQYTAPFFSSEGRFQPWNDWMSVHGKQKTPGPCYYNLENRKCLPAVHHGPLSRSPRFTLATYQTPAPNNYKLGGGIETVLKTHNEKLKNNIDNQHKFIWEPPVEPRKLSFDEQETLLINRSIALLEAEDIFEVKDKKSVNSKNSAFLKEMKKPKLLRYFLYNHQMPLCI